jgi:dTDP-4-dehydrorhamnose 3,5-epimerase-like enzyme
MLINHNVKGDERGKLIAIESCKNVSFDIKRVFFIYGMKNDLPRGNHSHYKTNQYLIAVSGSCKVLLDDGKEKNIYELNSPTKGLWQKPFVWGTMYDFSEDCVLMVLADMYYDPEDYILDYELFIKLIDGGAE